jgi:hypothetical protein
MIANHKPTTTRTVFLPYLFDIVGPFVTYLLVHWLGGPAFWALTAGGLVAGVSTAVNTIRRKGLDAVGMLVVLEIVGSILLMVFVRDPRLMLIRPSFYTGIAAVYMVYTAAIGRPLTFDASKPMATQGDPVREAAYQRTWDQSPEFRRTHVMVTIGFGLALIADSVLRVIIVYRFPFEESAWLSNVPHVTAMVLMIGASALAGRRFKRLAEKAMAGTAVGPNFSSAKCR